MSYVSVAAPAAAGSPALVRWICPAVEGTTGDSDRPAVISSCDFSLLSSVPSV